MFCYAGYRNGVIVQSKFITHGPRDLNVKSLPTKSIQAQKMYNIVID